MLSVEYFIVQLQKDQLELILYLLTEVNVENLSIKNKNIFEDISHKLYDVLVPLNITKER